MEANGFPKMDARNGRSIQFLLQISVVEEKKRKEFHSE
jgi:hypothetical protein